MAFCLQNARAYHLYGNKRIYCYYVNYPNTFVYVSYKKTSRARAWPFHLLTKKPKRARTTKGKYKADNKKTKDVVSTLRKRYKNHLNRLRKMTDSDVFQYYMQAFTALYDPHTQYLSDEHAKNFDIESNPGKYPIYFFKSDTSGEKTYEEFYTDSEDYELNKYDSLGYVNTKDVKISFEEVENDFNDVFKKSSSKKIDIINVIKKYVPDFQHIETGKHLDQKM